MPSHAESAPTRPSGPVDTANWHGLPVAEVAAVLETDGQHGLSVAESASRLARHGHNLLPQYRPTPAWKRFLAQFNNILIYVLLAAAMGALFLGDGIDAWVILGVVFINAVIGYIQEDKAESALNAIRNLLSLSATVVRDGARLVVPAEQLVPGDVVVIQAGDKVPADLRLTEARNLGLDESVLTGESGGVFKRVEAVAEEAVVGDRVCMAYSGTLTVSGQGTGIVVATAARTELGRISAILSQVDAMDTPLQRQFTAFGRWLTLAILVMSAAIFAYGSMVRGHSLEDMFMAMVAVAVAAIPEGLPAVVTITLAVGVQRMAKRNAIVRHLPAVETLGSVTVICSDKTGTLTANSMTVREIVLASGRYRISGEGYGVDGEITPASGGDATAALSDDVRQLARVAILCNDADLNGVALQGDPTEGALLGLASKAGLDYRDERKRTARLDAIPFESEHRFMATLHAEEDGGRLICLKGAPEVILTRCMAQNLDGAAKDLDTPYWEDELSRLADSGHRIIAVAYKRVEASAVGLAARDVLSDFTLAGLCALIDPPRQEAIDAVRSCRAASIDVKMITGDHGLTARAIGVSMGTTDEGRVLLGQAIEAMSDEELAEAVTTHDIFARTSPEHKLRLVRALQGKGEIVAMTGDGVNDAPALKAADVGVAMGQRGSEVAKDAAVIVLADDNFASIAHAVEEGRTIHDNLLKAIVFILPTSFAQAGAVVVGLLMGVTLPITPLQILWVNLVTAVTLSIALAFEPPEREVMCRPPRKPGKPLLGWFSLWRIVFVTVLLVFGLMGLYLYEIDHGESIEVARTAAVNALIVGEIFYLFNSRYIEAPILTRRGLFGNRYAYMAAGILLLLQIGMTYVPLLQSWFGTAALDLTSWGRIAVFGMGVLLVVELEKVLLRLLRGFREDQETGTTSPPGSHTALGTKNLSRYAMLSIMAAIVTIGLKATAYYLTGSVGLLSDAMESLVNLVAAMMALAMLMLAAKPPDEEHHYGHGKAEYFSSGLEGSLIIVAAIGIAVAAYDRLTHPQAITQIDIGASVSMVAAIINLWVALVLMRVGRRYGSITLEADAHHLLTDVWTSVGVILGLGAVYATGWQILDPLIAIAVAINIVWSGVELLKRSVAGLLDATLPAEENARIAQLLDDYRQQGIEFHDLRTRQSGVHRFMTVHILVPGSMTIQAGHDLAEGIEHAIQKEIGDITVVTHLEPLEDPASFNHIHTGDPLS